MRHHATSCAFTAILLVLNAGEYVFAQPGIGGGNPNSLSFNLVAQPASPVPLGTVVVVAIVDLDGGTPPYQYAWGVCCPPGGPGNHCAVAFHEENVAAEHFCMDRVPQVRVTAGVIDNGSKSGTKNIDIDVLPPDSVSLLGNPESTDGPPLFTLVHRFRFDAGSSPLGPCYDNCVYEKVAFLVDGEWDPEPVDWRNVSCPQAKKPGFLYSPPVIHDTKAQIIGGSDWESYSIGDIVSEYRQWIGIKISRCPPLEEYIFDYGPIHFKVKKISATRLKHEPQ